MLVVVASAVAIGSARASYYEDTYFSGPLIQADFTRLIPRSYPTIQPDFNALIPTTRPLIYPGHPRIHITENLARPTDQPLLQVN